MFHLIRILDLILLFVALCRRIAILYNNIRWWYRRGEFTNQPV